MALYLPAFLASPVITPDKICTAEVSGSNSPVFTLKIVSPFTNILFCNSFLAIVKGISSLENLNKKSLTSSSSPIKILKLLSSFNKHFVIVTSISKFLVFLFDNSIELGTVHS